MITKQVNMIKISFKYLGLPFVLAAVVYFPARSQNRVQMSLDYKVDIPTGDFRKDVSNTAGRGFDAAVLYAVTGRLQVGGQIGFNDFYQKFPRSVFEDGQGNTISAVTTNSVQQIPVQATVRYILADRAFVHPYVTAGAGLNIILYDQYLGEFSGQENKTRPAVHAGAGVYIPLSRNSPLSLDLGAWYQYAPFDPAGVKDVSTVALHAGILFPLH